MSNIFASMRDIFIPDDTLTISEHANRYRMLPVEASMASGKWRNYPYQVEIQDTICDPEVEEIVIMCSSQSGKSEILLNTLFYYSDVQVSPILVVQPTGGMLDVFSKDRLATSIRDSERYAQIFDEQQGKKSNNTISKKQGINGANVSLASAGSVSSLASRPVRVAILDEIDRYPYTTSEGCVLKLASQRTEAFANRKIVYVSTPTGIIDSRIYPKYLESDQRILQAKCLHCSDYFDLEWECVKWDKDKEGNHLPETAKLICPSCGALHEDYERADMVEDGHYRVRNPSSKIPGFHFNSLCTENTTLEKLVTEYIEAIKSPLTMQPFINLKLGKVYEQKLIIKGAADYDDRLSDYTQDCIPDEVLSISVGIDVQGNRFEMTYWGFGLDNHIYHLGYEILNADTSLDISYRELYDHLTMLTFTTISGFKMKPDVHGMDSGHQTKMVYKFAKNARNSKAHLKVLPLKGSSQITTPIFPVKRPNKAVHFMVGVHQAKDLIYNRLEITDTLQSGYIHFARELTSDDFFQQLHSERKEVKVRAGKLTYRYNIIDEKIRNEVLDTFVYAIAAHEGTKINLVYRQKKRQKLLATI